jgi:hypothetical protein
MADIRTTIQKTQDGRERINFGTATILNGTTSGTIRTDLHRVDSFFADAMLKYTESAGLVTVTFANPGETRVIGWTAIGL